MYSYDNSWNFSTTTPVLSVTRFFKNHANMLIYIFVTEYNNKCICGKHDRHLQSLNKVQKNSI